MAEMTDPVRGYSEPNRFWTFNNIGEATPDILSPLCWDVWADPLQEGFLAGMCALGVIPKSEVVVSPDNNQRSTGVFYGRQVFNPDALRPIMSRIPGVDVDDFERDVLGTVRPDAEQFPSAPLRMPIIIAKGTTTMLRLSKQVEANYQATKKWWRSEVLDVYRGITPPKRSAIEDLIDAQRRFSHSFYLHCLIRYQLMGVQTGLAKPAEKIGKPNLATAAMSGQGGVAETKLADDVWRIAHGELSLEDFITEYGFHGPNEGNVYSRSWREQPERVTALAKTQVNKPSSERPARRAEIAAVKAREAAEEFIASTSGADRLAVKFMLARARTVVPRLETGKAGYVIPIDGARAAARRIGAEQVDAGRFDEVDDAFFLTIPELRQVVSGGLPEARDLIAFRRQAREEYAAMTLPVEFKGMPQPISVQSPEAASGPVTVTGVAAGGGVAEGRARVVIDPNEDVELDEGDILVCKFTDPSWAPLFTMADALVIDVGGAASHGAVVAREMGIPYVIGTQNGTAVIREGDRIRVDGQANLVEVLG